MSGRLDEWPVVFVPCQGWPTCPDRLFEVDGHQHFTRAQPRLRVRRILPGCWEVWCPRCICDPVTGPVVAQVATWERAMQRASQHLAEEHSPVGRALTSTDPQPPPGSMVRDDCGQRWVNSGCYPSAWMPVDREDDPESWTKVAGNYGPVTVIEWGDEQ